MQWLCVYVLVLYMGIGFKIGAGPPFLGGTPLPCSQDFPTRPPLLTSLTRLYSPLSPEKHTAILAKKIPEN